MFPITHHLKRGRKLSSCAIACKDDTIEVLRAAKARQGNGWTLNAGETGDGDFTGWTNLFFSGIGMDRYGIKNMELLKELKVSLGWF